MDELQKLPSGFKSSEFYISLASSITGIAIMLGYITPEQGQHLDQQLKVFIDSLEVTFGALLAIVSMVAYIYSRLKLKQTTIENSTPSETMPNTPSSETTAIKSANPSYIVR